MNLAARLEVVAEPMEVVLHEEMRRQLDPAFIVEEIGLTEIRGFGRKRLFRLVGSDSL